MADSQIKMMLSLVDNASPALTGFMQKLKAMEAGLTSANAAFAKFNASLSSTSVEMGKVSSAFQGVTGSATAMESRLAMMASSMASAIRSTRSMAYEVRDLARELRSATQGANDMAGGLRSAGSSSQNFENRLSSLGHTIKGVGTAWAAAKIGHGLEESAEKATVLEDTQIRIKNAGGPELEARIRKAVEVARVAVPQMEADELSKIALDIYGASGHKEDVDKLASFAKDLYVMKKSDATGKFNDMSSMNYFKALEDRGSFMDPAKLEADREAMVKAQVGTQGRVGPQQWQMFLHTLRAGLGKSMSTESLMEAVPLIEAYGASTAATIINAMNRSISGSQIKKELIPNWKDLGLLSENGKTMKYYDEFRDNPLKYMRQRVLPAAEKKGINVKDDTQTAMLGSKLFGQQAATEGNFAALAKMEQFDRQTETIRKAADATKAYEEIQKGTSASVDKLKASLESLAQVVGERLLPFVRDITGFFADLADSISNGFKADEASANVAVFMTLLTSLALGVQGMISLFGLLPGVAGAASGGMLARFAPFATRFGLIGVAAIGAFTVGFVFWQAIKNFEVFGTTLDDLGTQMVINLMRTFDSLVTYLTVSVMGSLRALIGAGANIAAKVGATDTAMALQDIDARMAAANAGRKKAYAGREQIRATMDQESSMKAIGVMAAKRKPKGAPLPFPTADGAHHGSDKGDGGSSDTPAWLKKQNGSGGAGAAGGRSKRDPQAAIEAESARLAKESLSIHLHDIETLYKDHKIGVAELYAEKTAAIEKETALQVGALEREKAVLAKDSKRNAGAVAKIDTDIAIARMREKSKLLDLELEKRAAVEKLTSDGLNVEANLESVRMSGTKKRIALLDEEYRKKIEIFEVEGMRAQADAARQERESRIAKIKLDFETQLISRRQANNSVDEQSMQNAVKSGALTSLEAQQRTLDLRMQEGQILESMIASLEEMAKASEDPRLIDQIRKMRVEAEGLKNQFDEVTQTLRGGVQDGIAGALSALQGGKGFKGALAALSQSILDPINKMVNKNVSEMLTNQLFGQADGTGAGTGFLGKIGQQLFGSGAAGAGVSKFATKAGETGADLANSALSKLASDGAAASTTALVENATKSTLGATAQSMATMALQSLTTAAQTAAMALQSMGGGSGGGGMLSGLFGGGGEAPIGMDGVGDGFGSFFAALPGFAEGADSIPRDMIARIHKDEMILPAATAAKVKAGLSSGGGGGSMVVNNHFNVSGQTSRDTMNQIGTKAADALSRAQRRNG